MVFSLFSVNNFRIGGAPPFRSIKYLPNGEKIRYTVFTNLSRRLKENPAHAHRFRTYPLPHAHCLPVRRSSLSAPPGLAVSLPAITAQVQQLHTPLMILPRRRRHPGGSDGQQQSGGAGTFLRKRLPAAGAGLLLDLRRGLVCVHDWNAFYGRILDTDSPPWPSSRPSGTAPTASLP